MIYYALHPLPLPAADAADQPRYQARVQPTASLSFEELIERVAERIPGGQAAALSALHAFCDVCTEALLDGYVVNTPLFVTRLGISGPFPTPDDYFRPERNQVTFSASAGTTLRHALTHRARLQKRHRGLRTANLSHVEDLTTDRRDALSRGGVVRIGGYRLKLTAPDESLVCVLPDNREVPITRLVTNRTSQLMFLVPTEGLEPGQEVRLRLRNRMPNTQPLRDAYADGTFTIL